MKKNIAINADFVITTRKRLGLNQSQFWAPLGVTQSGGSRYESSRTIPAPTRKLIWLVHVVGLDANTVQRLVKV